MKIGKPTRNNGPLLRRVFSLAVVSFVLLIVPTACMSEPGDGETVGPTHIPITFSGFTTTPDQKITVEYYSHVYREWRSAGFAYTSATPNWSWAGFPWYQWSKSKKVNYDDWDRGRTGGKLRVRAIPETGAVQQLATVVPDFWGCWGAHNATLADFNSHCLGTNNPEAEITSSNYCDSQVIFNYGRIEGTDPTRWERTGVDFHEGQDGIYGGRPWISVLAVGEIAWQPTRASIGGAASCFAGSSNIVNCYAIGSDGVFADADEALTWLEGGCTSQGCGRTLDYRWDYRVPFGNCEETRGLGALRFSDFEEQQMVALFSADEDFDGIKDVDDECPSEPEDFDNYFDDDGCPEVEPQQPACFVMPGDTLCGTGAAPTGFVVTDLMYRADCCGVNGGGCNNQGVNARRVTPYTGIPAGFGCELRICTGYDAPPPPAWSVVNNSVSTLACQGTQLVARKQ